MKKSIALIMAIAYAIMTTFYCIDSDQTNRKLKSENTTLKDSLIHMDTWWYRTNVLHQMQPYSVMQKNGELK